MYFVQSALRNIVELPFMYTGTCIYDSLNKPWSLQVTWFYTMEQASWFNNTEKTNFMRGLRDKLWDRIHVRVWCKA